MNIKYWVSALSTITEIPKDFLKAIKYFSLLFLTFSLKNYNTLY